MEMRVAGNKHQNKQQMSPSLRDGRRESDGKSKKCGHCSINQMPEGELDYSQSCSEICQEWH